MEPKALSLQLDQKEASADDELFDAESDYPTFKTVKLRPKQYFDYETRNSEKHGYKHYEVYKVEALWPSKLIRLRYSEYIKFASSTTKDKESILELVIATLPGLELKGSNRKRIITEQFREVVSYCRLSLVDFQTLEFNYCWLTNSLGV